jgi:hypothetical protein
MSQCALINPLPRAPEPLHQHALSHKPRTGKSDGHPGQACDQNLKISGKALIQGSRHHHPPSHDPDETFTKLEESPNRRLHIDGFYILLLLKFRTDIQKCVAHAKPPSATINSMSPWNCGPNPRVTHRNKTTNSFKHDTVVYRVTRQPFAALHRLRHSIDAPGDRRGCEAM